MPNSEQWKVGTFFNAIDERKLKQWKCCAPKKYKQERIAHTKYTADRIDVGKQLTAWSVELLLYGTGIKRSCNSPPITFKK